MSRCQMAFRGSLLISSLVLLGLLSIGPQALAYDIQWGTAPIGGMWQPMGTAMLNDVLKANPNLKGSTSPIGGAASLVAVNKGKLNACLSFSTIALDAWEGVEYFKKYGKLTDIRALANLFPEPTQIAVRADSDIKEVKDLKGKIITPATKGSLNDAVGQLVMRECGVPFSEMDVRYMDLNEAALQFVDGHINAIVYCAIAYPCPPIVNVSSQMKIRLISLPEDRVRKIADKYKGLKPFTVKPGPYQGVDYEVRGVSADAIVAGSADMPNDVAYAIAKSLYENFDRYAEQFKAMRLGDRENMAKGLTIPIHPGAVKYYKEIGLAFD
ncbi:MAG: TAXI family TRAP transporter solute-binding subunit [Thermodesulfobacteriota bacterium]